MSEGKKCYAGGCDRASRSAKLCSMHYVRFKKYGDPNLKSKGKWFNLDGTRKTCTAPDCENPIHHSGLCTAHATRLGRHGSLDKPVPKMDDCPTSGCARKKSPKAALCHECRKIRWRYGISVERTMELMRPENRHCNNPGCGSLDDLHLDHDHSCCPPGKFPTKTRVSCGKCVRGWLCRSCNLAEGYLRASPERILGLLEYLYSNGTPRPGG